MTRKVVTRSPKREVGVVNAAWLLDHEVEHESHLERRFIMVALSCPLVVDIIHQPLVVWLGPDQTHRYTPDFLVTFASGEQVVIEVKPDVFLKKHRARLDAARTSLAGFGYSFLIVTDKHIDADGLGARAMLLMRYGRLLIGEAERIKCKQILEERFSGSATVKDLIAQGIPEEVIWNLVATHVLRIPAGLSISDAETVSLNLTKEESHDFFCTWLGLA
ncbi:TnsA endonuclease N-terminal domain-containing protein [Hydrogenophaga sp.]|uniref:TnsA endonuclease N-terminal domain-containing protein n=1 Tax=Hydrogenophaga sp. TaxID=1904254 RepID=UPI0027181BEB|nr:TnsA endonuclease N-terminal domain-containing protein [Hydrogenophaga sp.]MDO8905428.1 TnsA endonuclease N-terminal domain-containing protein [Hydrogenophaga sp.]